MTTTRSGPCWPRTCASRSSTGRASTARERGALFQQLCHPTTLAFVAGLVDGRAAVLVRDADDPDQRLKYFVLLNWAGEEIVGIRDFVFARYAMEGAELVMD